MTALIVYALGMALCFGVIHFFLSWRRGEWPKPKPRVNVVRTFKTYDDLMSYSGGGTAKKSTVAPAKMPVQDAGANGANGFAMRSNGCNVDLHSEPVQTPSATLTTDAEEDIMLDLIARMMQEGPKRGVQIGKVWALEMAFGVKPSSKETSTYQRLNRKLTERLAHMQRVDSYRELTDAQKALREELGLGELP